MLISIITPTNNSEKSIITAVKSVLEQSYNDFEHIIIDNKSSDRTIQLIENEYKKTNKLEKLRILVESDRGISDAFNKGINLAKGEIIGILNSDDSFYDRTVFTKINQAFQDNNILIVHGNIFFNDKKYGSNIRRPLQCDVQATMPYNHPGMFIRKSAYINYGLYDLNFKVAMDYELICRFKSKISDLEKNVYYLNGDPLAVMNAGGASWKNEVEGIEEGKTALKNNGLWNNEARKSYIFRIVRVRVKGFLTQLGLSSLIKYWRDYKWGNS